MKEFEYSALITTILIIKAENRLQADRQIKAFSIDGWHRLGEPIEVTDVDLIEERNTSEEEA